MTGSVFDRARRALGRRSPQRPAGSPRPTVGTDVAVERALRVDGWMPAAALAALAELAATVQPPACVVEIGTYRGRSSIALGLAAGGGAGARVFTFDPHDPAVGVFGAAFGPLDQQAVFENLLEADAAACVTVCSLDSRIAAQGWPATNVGLLLVDGDHSEHGVRADVEAWRPHLCRDAHVVFDDVDAPGVGLVVGELIERGELEIVERVESILVTKVPTTSA